MWRIVFARAATLALGCLSGFGLGLRLGLGLGLLHGEVRPISEVIPAGLKVPQMGWNALIFRKSSPLFKYIKEGDCVYFVHSYAAMGCDPVVTAVTEYGAELTACVQAANVMGCQFHPEKSGTVGLNILRAFCELETGAC